MGPAKSSAKSDESSDEDDPFDWRTELERTDDGTTLPTLHNLTLLFKNEPRISGPIGFNEHANLVVIRKPLGLKGSLPVTDPFNGDLWEAGHTRLLRLFMETPKRLGGYGMKVADRNIDAAIDIVARRQPFHPVPDYLDGLVWDGVKRVEKLWDYVGAPDDPYHRETATKWLVAGAARIFEPGHKFDFVPILRGLQGKRKSTFYRVVAVREEWFGAMKATFDTEQKMVEQMSGRWIMELPELSTIHRSDIEDVKAFLGEKKSIVRLAYGKRSQTFMRQCIFGGTTNKEKYLVDDQNRRYWPIYCDMPGDQEIDTDRLRSEIGQFWAEAVSIYREWRKAQPKGELPLYLTNADSRMIALTQQEEHRVETAADILAGEIEAWLDTPVRASKIMPEFADIKEGLPDPLVYRMKSCTRQIWQEALGKTVTPNHHETLLLGDAIGKLTGWRRASTATFPGYGKQRAIRRVGASPDDDLI